MNSQPPSPHWYVSLPAPIGTVVWPEPFSSPEDAAVAARICLHLGSPKAWIKQWNGTRIEVIRGQENTTKELEYLDFGAAQ